MLAPLESQCKAWRAPCHKYCARVGPMVLEHFGGNMCNCKINRRSLGKLMAGAAGAAALPKAANAATVTALAITCIDYRLVDDAVKFFDGKHLTNDYDQVSLAGASLAAVSDKFPSSNAAFWDHIGIAKTLHHIKKVIVV